MPCGPPTHSGRPWQPCGCDTGPSGEGQKQAQTCACARARVCGWHRRACNGTSTFVLLSGPFSARAELGSIGIDPSQPTIVSRAASYPARHRIPRGIVSRTALGPISHERARSGVKCTAQVDMVTRCKRPGGLRVASYMLWVALFQPAVCHSDSDGYVKHRRENRCPEVPCSDTTLTQPHARMHSRTPGCADGIPHSIVTIAAAIGIPRGTVSMGTAVAAPSLSHAAFTKRSERCTETPAHHSDRNARASMACCALHTMFSPRPAANFAPPAGHPQPKLHGYPTQHGNPPRAPSLRPSAHRNSRAPCRT